MKSQAFGVLMLSGVVYLLGSLSLNGFSYQAGGFFNHTNFTESGAVDSILRYPYYVEAQGEKVSVRVGFGTNTVSCWSFDGTNSYYLVDSAEPRKAGTLNAAATLNEKEFPYSSGPVERSVWLGLASGHFFAKRNEDPLLVPWLDWAFPGVLSFDWQIQRATNQPFLPAQIKFVASNNLWLREQAIKIGALGKWPYYEGEVGGRFSVSQFVTNGQLTLPAKFEIIRYFRGSSAAYVLSVSAIEVTNFSVAPAHPNTFVPKIGRATDVSDMRSETDDMPRFGITYTLTNNGWMDKSDPIRLAMIESNKPVYAEWRRVLAAKERGGKPKNNNFVKVLLALSVSGPVVLYLILKNKPKEKHEK